MPAISRIRFTNVIYENGAKRFNDDIFHFDGYNGAVLLENGGGKTVFVQTALQTILPHHDLEERKIRDTLSLEGSPCHIAIEWILHDKPRRYVVTAVTLFITNNRLDSYRYTYEYSFDDPHTIETLPFVKESQGGNKRPASKGEIYDYYQAMQSRNMNANTFPTIKAYNAFIEKDYKIIASEWRSIARINSAEGGVEAYFENCKTTGQLVDRLLVPVVQEAISENGTKDFVDTFQEQRERFKKHRQLRERIEESKQIEDRIDKYVQVFTDYHEIEKEYLGHKRHTKAIYQHLQTEKTSCREQQNKNQGEKEAIQEERRELERKEYSYELAVLQKELGEYDEKRKQIEKTYQEIQLQYDEKSSRCTNLKVAKWKHSIKETEDSILNYKEQLKRYESNMDLEEIKTQLEENGSRLRGYYIGMEEEFNKQKNAYAGQQDRVNVEKKEEEEKLQSSFTTKEKLLGSLNQNKGHINEIRDELNRLQTKLPQSAADNMREKRQEWTDEVGKLEQRMMENSKNKKDLEAEKPLVEEDLKEDRERYVELKQKQSQYHNKMDLLNERQNDLLIEIKTFNDSWYYYDSLYKRQDSILHYMMDKGQNLNKEKENFLLEERTTGRLKDDYGDSIYFTPEPLLEKWMLHWKNQFKYIETGTQYIQRAVKTLKIKEEELLKAYPYWLLSIVVEDNEVQKLKDKIAQEKNKIHYPIFILGQKEAIQLVKQGKEIDEVTVFPKYWSENIKSEGFEQWKKEVAAKLDLIMDQRKRKEGEIAQLSQCFNSLQDFYKQYSYDEYKTLKENISSVEEKLYILNESIQSKETRLDVIHSDVTRLHDQIVEDKDAANYLNQCIQYAHDYLTKEREIEQYLSDIYQIQEQIKRTEKEISTIQQEISRFNNILEGIKAQMDEISDRINTLMRDPLYEETKNYDPIFTERSKAGLEEERKNLNAILGKKQQDIAYIYDSIKKDEGRKEELEKYLRNERSQSDYPIDENIDFALYEDEDISKLIENIKTIKPIKTEKKAAFDKVEKEYNKKHDHVTYKQDAFYENFQTVFQFNEPLFRVKENLVEENESLQTKEKENKDSYERLLKELTELEEEIKTLEIENGKYEFLIDRIQPIVLTSEFYRDFPYHRHRFVQEQRRLLEASKEKLKGIQNQLDYHKNQFIKFCEAEIRDPKLRERTVTGVQQKDQYDQVLDWQGRMRKSIQTTIQIAEDDMREHDQDLEQFINHLFVYLRTITEELAVIPKKTRIKVEDKWKEIYQFHIPSWQEEEGKQELRKYIDWIIQELDNPQYKNEDGTDNIASIRKEIEKWMDAKQLLPVVLQNNPIKISCRKVTNDNKISSSLITWESSNRWSGGEKWSKNMTLFLGILNYIAEKRQGIIPGTKTNRTVIVDNPFGKASSDHVLDPVFFIAQKLGFQMIALTAHSEGNFIRNYFPVVYSCRLREAMNYDGRIIDKEKEIQYAFFQDHDPDAFNRLQEKKQVTLFDEFD